MQQRPVFLRAERRNSLALISAPCERIVRR
jgi:hypothetical protein